MATMSFMRLFPKSEWTFRSPIPADEVLERLRASLDNDRSGNAYRPGIYFGGKIEGNQFTIREITHFRGNSGAPVVHGTVLTEGSGSLIRLNLATGGCVRVFVLVWCWVPLLLLGLDILNWIRGAPFNWPIAIAAMGAILIIFRILWGGFRDGSAVVREFMEQTFEGELNEQ